MALEDIARLVGHQGSTVTDWSTGSSSGQCWRTAQPAMERIFGAHKDARPNGSDVAPEALDDEGQEDTPTA